MKVSEELIYKTEKKLVNLARKAEQKEYEEGLDLINSFMNKYGEIDEILVQKAFFLYHYSAYLMYTRRKIKTRQKLIDKMFKEATDICKKILKKNNKTDERNLLNSRIYLAQIYAMKGLKRKAIFLAKQNFKYFPSTMMAERAADIHFRLGNFKGSIFYYKRSINLAKNSDEKLMPMINLAINYKHMNKDKLATNTAEKALKFSNSLREDENVLLLKESLYEYFPILK